MVTESTPVNTAARLGRLEAEVEGITGAVRSLSADFQNFAREVRGNSRTNWGWIVAAVGLVVSIMTGLLVLGARGPIGTLDELKTEMTRRHADDIAHAEKRGALEERMTWVLRVAEAAHGSTVAKPPP